MSDQFHKFSEAVAKQFQLMSKGELYVVNITGDELYEAYQASFPAGTNEIFRTAREHECSCCRAFIKNIGNVVAITKTGLLTTVWDMTTELPHPYNEVAGIIGSIVRNRTITGIFRATEPQYGNAQTKEISKVPGSAYVNTWNHFVGKLSTKHHAGKEAAEQIGVARASYQVLKRGLTELKKEAFSDVLDLLNQKALYRGEEFAFAMGQLYGMQGKYNSLETEAQKDTYIWQNINEPGARLRNTAFGTLLIDLSGVPERTDDKGEVIQAKAPLDLESAVKAYEKVMAPENYKRPTALITPRMVQDAMKTMDELGIEPATHRRFATIADVSINDILFVDNEVRGKMKDGSVAGLLMDAATQPTIHAQPANTEDIGIDKFIAEVLPKATSMALLVKNTHQNNFVSLTTAVDAAALSIFKWPSPLAWSYDGNITDSIRERVKAAGGRTEAVLRVSLAWTNSDDLDLHVIEPNCNEIYFNNRGVKSRNTGMLDVDMNRSSSGHEFSGTEPVENVTWSRPMDGAYKVVVNNYNKRSTNNPGFTLELESASGVHQYSCAKSPSSGQSNHAMTLDVKGGKIVKVTAGAGIIGGSFSQEKWGVNTEQFVKVDTMMLSPNHQDGLSIGNKHYFFILEGCKNPVPTRGIYNEFLKPELEKHRKVFEVLGNKTMCEPTEQQLSGVGFSSTRGDTVVVQVNGRKTYNLKF